MIFIMNAGHSHLIRDSKENRKQTENHDWLCSVSVLPSMNVQKGQANNFYTSSIVDHPN